MAHGMKKNDKMMVTGKQAWHGLGKVVEQAPTPEEALKVGGLDWQVIESDALTGKFSNETFGDKPVSLGIDTHKMLVRSDDKTPLGIVGHSYSPVQNADLADLCYAITADEAGKRMNLKVESAGSIWGGKRVWFLIQGDSFVVGSKAKDDVTHRYLLAHNGHDGLSALAFLPTSIRVVCQNTLNAAMGRLGRDGVGIKMKHTANLDARIDDARAALGFITEAFDAQAEQAKAMGAKKLSAEGLQRLWTDVYMAMQGPVTPPTDDMTNRQKAKATQKYDKMVETLGAWTELFDKEVSANKYERTVWTGINAVTNWLDHDKPQRETTRTRYTGDEARIGSNLFGYTAKKKAAAVKTALAAC